MASFQGFKCDSCGNVIEQGERTRKVVKLDGGKISGEYQQDLCPDCTTVPSDVVLKPLRRRRTTKHEASASAPVSA